jgi:hypothetical protein
MHCYGSALARAALFPIRLSWVRLASLKLFMHASSLMLLLPSLALNSRIRDPSTLRLPEALKYGARDMHNKLQGRTNKLKLREQPAKQLTIKKPERIIDICEISYLAFYTNLKYFKNTLFSLSLYKLDRKLKDRKRGQE